MLELYDCPDCEENCGGVCKHAGGIDRPRGSSVTDSRKNHT